MFVLFLQWSCWFLVCVALTLPSNWPICQACGDGHHWKTQQTGCGLPTGSASRNLRSSLEVASGSWGVALCPSKGPSHPGLNTLGEWMFTWYSLDHFTSVMIHDSDCSFYFAFPPLCADIIFSRVFADNFKQDHPLHPLDFGRIFWSCIKLCLLFAVEFGSQTANADGVTEGASIPMALPHVLCWLCHGGGTMIAAQDLGALHVDSPLKRLNFRLGGANVYHSLGFLPWRGRQVSRRYGFLDA